ncbi:hypothetical protein [Arthrobacter sp. B6]|uniref:hypothetical protein n=1 Tax=Arthrobacter sp. B6 TaxID=1570137 RepID=UPI00082AB8BF|nr:hypothetical protein [Arthrobacter sp. B6]
MRSTSALGLAAASVLALAACTGGGDGQGTSPTATATTSAAAEDKVYTEDELRGLIAGMRDAEGNELKLYSQDQVDQGGNIANLLMSTAKVDPEDCKSIATAGLLDKVDDGDVAVAISESSQPRTLSAQSGSEGADAVELLREISGKMDQCANFSVEALGERYDVSSEELRAETDGEETFATVSTRGQGTNEMLMQVSAAEGRLLVIATKGGADLGDDDQKELEDLVDEVLAKADGGTATASPTGTSTASPTGTSTGSPTGTLSPTTTASPTGTATDGTRSPSPTTSGTSTATP